MKKMSMFRLTKHTTVTEAHHSPHAESSAIRNLAEPIKNSML